MKVAFITPTFHTLAPTWRRDPQIVKLATPQIAGALFANGLEDLRQYDFEVQVFDLERSKPGTLDLRVFFDDTNVDAFLQSDHSPIRHQANLILDTLGVEAADLYAFSCASVLEIYADMHAVGNLNLCLGKLLKERHPGCRTLLGGLKISPDSKHKAEYRSMLQRSPFLDYVAEGRGEAPILQVVDSMKTGQDLASMGEKLERIGNGVFIHGGSKREMRLSPQLAREEGIKVARGYTMTHVDSFLVNGAVPGRAPEPNVPEKFVQLNPLPQKLGMPVGHRDDAPAPALSTKSLPIAADSARPQLAAHDHHGPDNSATPDAGEFGPQGDQERKPIFNPSVMLTPWFDPKNIEKRKLTGRELLCRYHLDGTKWEPRLAPFDQDKVAILPSIFMEGCNARCAFCAYSMTKMVTRDVKEVVRSLAWMRDTHGVRYFHFLNTNINGSMKYAEAFCDELIAAKLDILWSDCANLWALNPRLIEKMRLSGCIRFTYGLECPSDKMLDYVGKGITVAQAHERLKMLHDVGIWNHLLLITGLPTETDQDLQHFVDFLERSAPYANAYSISSFYLIGSSLMGAFPHRYNLEMRPNPTGLLEDQGFNEIGGLPWDQKKRQIIHSTELVTNAIKRIKVEPKYWSGAIDLELLFWLYDRLGHDNKQDIVACYEDAFLGAPAHPKSYLTEFQRQLAQNGHGPARHLARAGLTPRPEQLEIRRDAVVLPVESKAGGRAELEIRCLTTGQRPNLASGLNLGMSLAQKKGFGDFVRASVAEGSALEALLARSGWNIVDRELRRDGGAHGFRMNLVDKVIDVVVAPLGPEGKAFVKQGSLGVSYSVPHGAVDATKDPKVMELVKSAANLLLTALSADPEVKSAASVDPAALQEFALEFVAESEKTFGADIANEPVHKHANVGRRMRDQYSKVEGVRPVVS